MKRETELFAGSVMREGASFETLLTASHSFVTPELAAIYDTPIPASAKMVDGFARVDFDPMQRAGILTHASFLASKAHPDQTSVVHRGLVISERMMCFTIGSPPSDVNDTLPELVEGLSKREQAAQHQENPTCAGCHRFLDSIGFGFENYDAIGAFRTTDRDEPVDARGNVHTGDIAGPFDGAMELIHRVVQSEDVQRCVARNFYRFATGRADTADDAATIAAAVERFREHELDLRELMIGVVTADAYRLRRIAKKMSSTAR